MNIILKYYRNILTAFMECNYNNNNNFIKYYQAAQFFTKFCARAYKDYFRVIFDAESVSVIEIFPSDPIFEIQEKIFFQHTKKFY